MKTIIKHITFYYQNNNKSVSAEYHDFVSFSVLTDDIIQTTHEIHIEGEIEGDLFSIFPLLRTIIWKESGDTIPACAFRNCRSLQEIQITDQITSVGQSAFESCVSLKTINLPNAEAIDSRAFYDCVSLETINAPKIRKLQSYAFAFCKKLKDIDSIIANLRIIPAYCFCHCESIQKVSFPETLNEIGKGSFSFCTDLKTVNFNSSLKKIYEGAFEYSGLKEATIPENTIVYPFAFYNCLSLETVTLKRKYQESLNTKRPFKAIADFSFAECTNIQKINYAGTTIDDAAVIFYGSIEPSVKNYYVLSHQNHNSSKSISVQTYSLPGYFEIKTLPAGYFRNLDEGRMFVNEDEEHILLQWDNKQKWNEVFSYHIPESFGDGRNKDLILHQYWYRDAIYYAFLYNYEHSGMSDTMIEHGYISNIHNGYYSHLVYLEKGFYKYEQISYGVHNMFDKVKETESFEINI